MRNASEAQIKSLKAALAAERAKTAGLQESLALTIKSNEQLAARVNAAETKLAEAQAEARLYRDNAAQAMTWFEQLKSERAKTAELLTGRSRLLGELRGAEDEIKWQSNRVKAAEARTAKLVDAAEGAVLSGGAGPYLDVLRKALAAAKASE